MQKRGVSKNTHVIYLGSHPRISGRAQRRELPVVDLVPPSTDSAAQGLSAEGGIAVPEAPAGEGQSPERTLHQRKEDLLGERKNGGGEREISNLVLTEEHPPRECFLSVWELRGWEWEVTHLVSDGDPRNSSPGIGATQAGEIALFEAQVGQWGEIMAPGGRSDHMARVDDVGRDAASFGGSIVHHGLLFGGCGRRVDVVVRRGVSVDRSRLDDLGNLEDRVGHCGVVVL